MLHSHEVASLESAMQFSELQRRGQDLGTEMLPKNQVPGQLKQME